MIQLESATANEFQSLVGEEFQVSAGENSPVETAFVLREVQPLGSPAEGRRQSFSLLFDGPPDLPVSQQLLWLRNSLTGPLQIFIVPIAGDAVKRRYEAVFN